MKRLTLLVSFLMALVFLGAVSAPIVSAQPVSHPLDGKWLKCKVNGKGYKFDPGTNSYSKQNGSLEAYLHFAWNVNHYDVVVWTNPNGNAGPWESGTPATATPVEGENFIPQFQLEFSVGPDKQYIQTSHTPYIKYDKNGKITYKGTGEVYGGDLGYNQAFYGYFNISGTSVDETKLPFDPFL
jgi:hypothetical protein